MKTKSVYFWAQLIFTLIAASFLVVPICQSALAGLTRNYFKGVSGGLTLRWIVEVWLLYRDTIFRTLFIGLACLGLNLAAGVPAAYAMVKSKNRLTRLIEEFLVIPLAVPGLAIALGILTCYGQWTGFRKSWLIILAGHLVFTLPFMVRSVIAVLSSFDLEILEESAASLGAGFWQRFFHIVVPNAIHGILSGALMVFTLSIGEFNLTWMLHTPLTKTLPVGLADSYASMRLEIGAAYTLVFLLMIIPLLMAMQWTADYPEKFQFLIQRGKQIMIQPIRSLLKSARTAGKTGGGSKGRGPAGPSETGTGIFVEKCAKTFADGTRALEPVSLQVEPGETLVILGPSGCGKTTFLRIIAGLESPDPGGRVMFNGEDVTRIPIENRNVGMVFQSYALFPNMTVAENICYGLKLKKEDPAKQDRRLHEMLDMMKIEPLKDRRIDQLSGGQRQRVALARAIAARPRILLLDEPLTALDAKLRDTLRVEIDMLLRSIGITAVYVTHDQAEAMALGDRIVVMDQGRVSQVGTPKQIYFSPENRFVAEFVGILNRLPAESIRNNMNTFSRKARLSGEARAETRDPDFYFRPEHAGVVPQGQGHFSARVISAVFVGDRTQLLVEEDKAGGGDRFHIQASGRTVFKPGDIIDVMLDCNELFTLPRRDA